MIYSKTSSTGQKFFNDEDKKLVRLLKEKVKKLPKLQLPLDSDYLIVETDGSNTGWGGVLLSKPHPYSPKEEEKD